VCVCVCVCVCLCALHRSSLDGSHLRGCALACSPRSWAAACPAWQLAWLAWQLAQIAVGKGLHSSRGVCANSLWQVHARSHACLLQLLTLISGRRHLHRHFCTLIQLQCLPASSPLRSTWGGG